MPYYIAAKIERERNQNRENQCKSGARSYALRTLVEGGLAIDPLSHHPLSTSPLERGKAGKYIYAVRNDTMRVGPDGDRSKKDVVKHETLFRNLPVQAAGEIRFHEGAVIDINDLSGTYLTEDEMEEEEFRRVVAESLREAGVALSQDVRRRIRV